MTEDISGASALPSGSHPSGQAPTGLVASRFDPSRVELGLPWPWRFHKIAIQGDTCFFWATSPRTFALGFEDLQDGFILFIGIFCVGWSSMSAALSRDASAIEAGTGETTQIGSTEGESAAPSAETPDPPLTPSKESDNA